MQSPFRRPTGLHLAALTALAAALLGGAPAARAQATGLNGYVAVPIDGIADVGAHFALGPIDNFRHTGLFYLADRRELWAGTCSPSSGCRLETRISPVGVDQGRFVSLAMRAGARPIGVYYDAATSDLRFVNCIISNCANYATGILDGSGRSGEGTSIAIDPTTGFAGVAYRDGVAGSLRFYRCANFDCTSGSAVVVDPGPQVGANPSLAFDGSGRAFIAYDDEANATLKLAVAPPGSMSFTTGVATAGSDGVVVPGGTQPTIYYRDGSATLRRRDCQSGDCSLGTEQQLSAPGLGASPSVVVDGSGVPTIAHRNANTGAVYLTRCADAACSAFTRIDVDTRADPGRAVQVVPSDADRPLVFWHQAARNVIADALCADAACSSVRNPRIALNGPSASFPGLAIRANGSPVLIYRHGDTMQRLALCADPRCTSHTRVELPAVNSIDPSAVVVRTDDRPLAYYGSLGGSAAYDCLDVACTAGIERPITASGSGTSALLAAVLRGDNRPLLVYVRRVAGSPVEYRVYVCADEGCASGSDRLLAAEAPGTFASRPRAMIGPGDRLIVVYAAASSNFQTYSTRYVRCNDPDCTAATVTLVGNAQILDVTAGLRSDGRVVFRENLFPVPRLATCGSPDCPLAGVVRVDLPFGFRSSNALVLDADRPVFDAVFAGFSTLDRCTDPACSAVDSIPVIRDPELPDRTFVGALARDAQLRPIAAWSETTLGDVWLSVPLPEPIFANGFEP